MRRIIALPLALLTACHSHHSHGGDDVVPVFFETERNDDPLTANHFGLLRPGDHFFIDGFVRDDLADPFDGFAFTAEEPLHVDFQLFIGNAQADLDVCLYDPAIDETVACFATSDDPERGGVDVFAGGLDFQLVVESFVGDASYSLEIVVLPLFALTTEERPAASLSEARRLSGVNARADHVSAAEIGYRKGKRAPSPALEIEQVFEIDSEHGLVLELMHLRRADER